MDDDFLPNICPLYSPYLTVLMKTSHPITILPLSPNDFPVVGLPTIGIISIPHTASTNSKFRDRSANFPDIFSCKKGLKVNVPTSNHQPIA